MAKSKKQAPADGRQQERLVLSINLTEAEYTLRTKRAEYDFILRIEDEAYCALTANKAYYSHPEVRDRLTIEREWSLRTMRSAENAYKKAGTKVLLARAAYFGFLALNPDLKDSGT